MKCKFHPLDPAINRCDFCDANFCEPCSDESALLTRRSRAEPIDHSCFVCNSALGPLKGSQHILPFWSRLSEVYRYPLNTQAIIALLVVSVITALLGNASLFLIVPSVAMMLYSFACLRETAKGNLKAPGLEACFEGSIVTLLFVLIAILVLGGGVYNVFKYFGAGMGILAAAFFVLAIPAIVIIIAVEERLMPALNPAELFAVIRATGISYFVMLLFMLIMTSSVFALMSFFAGQSDSFIGILLQSLVTNYYGVVTYHIMGYLVYQNQEVLGFKTKVKREQSSARSDSARLKAQLELLIKAGEYEAAREIAGKQLREPDASLWDWSRAFTLMCVSKPSEKAKLMFNDYASKLEAAGEMDKLADAYLQLKRQQPKFVIEDHEQRLRVAKSFFEIGQYSQVVNILHMFHQQSKDNSRVTRALKLLSESSSSIPGREKLANQYATLYEVQLKNV